MTEEQFNKLYEILQINIVFVILIFGGVCLLLLIKAFNYLEKEQETKDRKLKEKIKREIEKAKNNE